MDGAYHILVCAQLYTGLTQPMHMAGAHLDSSESRAGNRAMPRGYKQSARGRKETEEEHQHRKLKEMWISVVSLTPNGDFISAA